MAITVVDAPFVIDREVFGLTRPGMMFDAAIRKNSTGEVIIPGDDRLVLAQRLMVIGEIDERHHDRMYDDTPMFKNLIVLSDGRLCVLSSVSLRDVMVRHAAMIDAGVTS